MTTTSEIEILLKKAVTLLHSPHANSATELRLLLDEEIKKRYGSDKTLTNTLGKKQLDDEANFPGRAATPPPQPVETEEVINLVGSPAKTISDSPDTIADSDDAVSAPATVEGLLSTTADEETNLKEFGDLNCCICGEIRFTATNRLIECSKCGALYHQECHKPAITDEEASEDHGHDWQCDNCISKPTITQTAKVTEACSSSLVVMTDEPMPLITSSVTSIKSKSSATSSRSSSSSNSSSPYHKLDQVPVVTPIVNIKSSSKAHRDDRVTSSNKASSINSSLSSSSSKKHSSSSSSGKSKSSSKHHDSKRKSNK